eukprot:7461500-Alexandrium_andersonii.AAC.1
MSPEDAARDALLILSEQSSGGRPSRAPRSGGPPQPGRASLLDDWATGLAVTAGAFSQAQHPNHWALTQGFVSLVCTSPSGSSERQLQ